MNSASSTPFSRLFKSSSVMAGATFSSRILGLVREQVMAAFFGASGVTDAYFVAYRIPNLLRDLLAEGSFSSAFVPVFTEELQQDRAAARRLLWRVFSLLGFLTILVALGIAVFAPELVALFAPKFRQDPSKLELTVYLLRIMAPFIALASLSALFMGALNALKFFFVPAFTPAVFNLIMIGAIVGLPPILEARGIPEIAAMAFGVILGGIVQLLIHIVMALRQGMSYLGPWRLWCPQTKRILGRIGIGTVGVAATQINVLINTILATGTVVGAVSWLTYGFRLFQFPVGILGVSVAGSNLVHFSDAWKRGEKQEAVETLSSSVHLALLLILPALALLLALAEPTMHLIFEHGAFSHNDTMMAALALKYYLVGLPFYAIYKIFAPTFYAIDRPHIPVFLSVLSIGLNIAFCLYFVPRYGFGILALGTSLAMIVNTKLQGLWLIKCLEAPWNLFRPLKSLLVVLAALLCYGVTYYGKNYFFSYGDTFWQKVFWFCLIGASGALAYLIGLLLTGQLRSLRRFLQK